MKKAVTEERANAFKAELKALLEKYNADVFAYTTGDSQGVSIQISVDIDDNTVLKVGDCLTAYDIKI